MDIRGIVTLPAEAPDLAEGTLFIRLEDVTYLDEAAVVALELRLDGIEHSSGEDSQWAFAWREFEPSPGRDYSLYAHLSVAGDSVVRGEDWVTTRSYPLGPEQRDPGHRLVLGAVR